MSAQFKNNSHSHSQAEISFLSLDGQPSADTSFAAHFFEKSMKNINQPFNNKLSIISTVKDDQISPEPQMDELRSQENLSSQHCQQVICKGNQDLYDRSLSITQSYLSQNVPHLNDITTGDFEALRESIKSLLE